MKANVEIRTWGKFAKYGSNVYKVGRNAAEALIVVGWKLVHRGDSYWYLQAPPGEGGKRVTVTIDVPGDEEIHSLANHYHALGQRFWGKDEVYACTMSYRPARTHTSRMVMFNSFGQDIIETREHHDEAEFTIRKWGVWEETIRFLSPSDPIGEAEPLALSAELPAEARPEVE